MGSDPIRLVPGLVTVDVTVLRRAVSSGEIDRALLVWGGEPFAGLSISEEGGWTAWVDQVRAETRALLAAGLEDAAAAAVTRGSPEDAIRYLGKATETLPRRAEAWARLVEVQTDFGRLRDARTTLAAAWSALAADTYEARLGDLERRVSLGGDPSRAQSENDVLGREADTAAVAEAWRTSLEGRTSVVVFGAGVGGGKTRMMREAEAPLVTPGAHVIHIECRSEDVGAVETWRTVREIIRHLSTLPGADHAMVDSADRLSELAQLSVEELVHPFLDFFASVCRTTPVLLTLDDVEWIDLDSWNLLKRLIRLRPASAILIVASLTAEGGPEGGPAGDIAAWWDKGWVTMRSLRPLSSAEVEAAVRLRGWRDDGFVRSLRDVLHMRSQGSPAAVFGLLDSMAVAGVRPPPPGYPASRMPELPHLDELPFSDGLLRFHEGRLAQLKSRASEILSLLGPTDAAQLETLSYAANSEPETVSRVLSELEGARFVVSSSDGYRLAHPDYAKLGSKSSPSPGPAEPTWSGGDARPMRSTPLTESTPSAPFAPSTPSIPSAPSAPATPSPLSASDPPATPRRLGDSSRRLSGSLGSAGGGDASATGSSSRPVLIRSPGLGSLDDFDDPLPTHERSIFPSGWRPQPPAYIAAALLIGIIWIIWLVLTRG